MQLTTTQREHLERRLQEERSRVLRDLNRAVGDLSEGDEQDRSGDLTKVPFHPADRGSDTMETELADIDAALERLYRTPERFGICEDTGQPIPFERLEVIPWARTCDAADG